jgi:AmmeMemoRadiSam system protein A
MFCAMPSESEDPARPELTDEDKRSLLILVRETLDAYLTDGRIPKTETDSPALLEPRATFVTLRRRGSKELRGCRGEVVARQPLVESVAYTAILSATEDPRFPPITAAELPDIHIEISALTPMKPIRPEEVVVGTHGLMIQRGPFAGLLLPQVPGDWGWNREQFLDALCQKAGLPDGTWHEPGTKLSAFEAEVWEEEES